MWVVAATFFRRKNLEKARWLDDVIVDPELNFVKVAPPTDEVDWHSRKGRTAGIAEWLAHWHHAKAAMALDPEGIITVFPQIGLTVAVHKRLFRRHFRLVAWCFNVGKAPGRFKRWIGRFAFRSVDHVVVHSRSEIALVHGWFGIPRERISFVHLQTANHGLTSNPDLDEPFVLSMGSANRDYLTLVEAVRGTDVRLIIVASPRCLSGIAPPPNVRILTNLPMHECRALAARALINVVALEDVAAASGQVTLIEAMAMGSPVIATRVAGTIDYVDDGVTGMLVAPNDPEAMRAAIDQLWHDSELRAKIGANARRFAIENLSDRVAGERLREIIKKPSMRDDCAALSK